MGCTGGGDEGQQVETTCVVEAVSGGGAARQGSEDNCSIDSCSGDLYSSTSRDSLLATRSSAVSGGYVVVVVEASVCSK